MKGFYCREHNLQLFNVLSARFITKFTRVSNLVKFSAAEVGNFKSKFAI